MSSHHQGTSSSRSRSRGCTAISSPTRSSHPSSHGDASVFVPMPLDSSPPYVDDSGYAEFWPDPHPDCEPTQVHTSQRHSVISSASKRATSPSPTHLSRTSGLTALPHSVALSHPRVSSHLPASPSYPELPSPLIEARFVSPAPSPTLRPLESWKLSPSDTSRFSWSQLSSRSFLGSPDVPQASFSTSPPPFARSNDAKEDGYCSDLQSKLAEHSHDSSQGSLIGEAPSAEDPEETDQWDYVSLESILGDLDADPWTALSKLLGLPSSPAVPPRTAEDICALLGTSYRRGVGYTEPTSLPDPASFPGSQSLEDDCHEDSAPLYSGSVVSPPGLFLGGGCWNPYVGQQTRDVEPVELPMVESTLLHGTCLFPRCSRSTPT